MLDFEQMIDAIRPVVIEAERVPGGISVEERIARRDIVFDDLRKLGRMIAEAAHKADGVSKAVDEGMSFEEQLVVRSIEAGLLIRDAQIGVPGA